MVRLAEDFLIAALTVRRISTDLGLVPSQFRDPRANFEALHSDGRRTGVKTVLYDWRPWASLT